MDKYEIVKRLGVGAHGAVYLVKQTTTKKLLAMKKIEVDERKKTRTKEAVLKEASILSQLRHPHIILFHESFFDPAEDYVCMILDYCDGGNLSERIQDAAQNDQTFSEKQIMQEYLYEYKNFMDINMAENAANLFLSLMSFLRMKPWFIQIVMAVQYIHSKHILHRDLKSENVFLNKRNVIKVGDFGISKILDNTIDVAKTVVGTPSYLSPELCQDIPYNSKSDIWAVGCLLYEMSALRPPFDGQSLISLFVNIIKAGYRPFPPETPTGIQDLVSKILLKAPENRPSASAILNLPYVKQHLASFIADTENIRAFRSKRENSFVTPGGDNNSLSPLPPSSYMEKPFPMSSKSPFSPRKQKSTDPVLLSYEYDRQSQSASSQPKKHAVNDLDIGSINHLMDPKEHDDDSDYSDDFDDSSLSEIGEELFKDGDGGDRLGDEEAVYVSDFEDSDSGEDLDMVVSQAKEAQVLEPLDDFFVDDDDMALSQTLTQMQVFRSHMEAARSQVTHL